MPKSRLQTETEFFFRASSKLNALWRAPKFEPDEIEDTVTEIEAIAIHTDGLTLKCRASKIVQNSYYDISETGCQA